MARFRYFNQFCFQDDFYKAELCPDFFYKWHEEILQTLPVEYQWHKQRSSCINHLISHKNCPNDLRDIYLTDSKYDRRYAAYNNGSCEYKFSNIKKVLFDRSSFVSESATRFLLEVAQQKHPNYLSFSIFEFNEILQDIEKSRIKPNEHTWTKIINLLFESQVFIENINKNKQQITEQVIEQDDLILKLTSNISYVRMFYTNLVKVMNEK